MADPRTMLRLPRELQRILMLQFMDFSDVYALRLVCHALLPVANSVLIEMVENHIGRDHDVFWLLDQLSQVHRTLYELKRADRERRSILEWMSVGRLLKLASVPADTLVAHQLVRRVPCNERGLFLKGWKINARSLSLLIDSFTTPPRYEEDEIDPDLDWRGVSQDFDAPPDENETIPVLFHANDNYLGVDEIACMIRHCGLTTDDKVKAVLNAWSLSTKYKWFIVWGLEGVGRPANWRNPRFLRAQMSRVFDSLLGKRALILRDNVAPMTRDTAWAVAAYVFVNAKPKVLARALLSEEYEETSSGMDWEQIADFIAAVETSEHQPGTRIFLVLQKIFENGAFPPHCGKDIARTLLQSISLPGDTVACLLTNSLWPIEYPIQLHDLDVSNSRILDHIDASWFQQLFCALGTARFDRQQGAQVNIPRVVAFFGKILCLPPAHREMAMQAFPGAVGTALLSTDNAADQIRWDLVRRWVELSGQWTEPLAIALLGFREANTAARGNVGPAEVKAFAIRCVQRLLGRDDHGRILHQMAQKKEFPLLLLQILTLGDHSQEALALVRDLLVDLFQNRGHVVDPDLLPPPSRLFDESGTVDAHADRFTRRRR